MRGMQVGHARRGRLSRCKELHAGRLGFWLRAEINKDNEIEGLIVATLSALPEPTPLRPHRDRRCARPDGIESTRSTSFWDIEPSRTTERSGA